VSARIPRGRRKGASAIGFALTAPFLFAVFSGIMEYGMIFFNQVGVFNAVGDGARIAVSVDEDDAESVAETRALEVLDELGLTCAAGCDVTAALGTGPGGYDTITVTAEVPYDVLFGLIPTPANLTGSIGMRYKSFDFGS
jgi:Flp pilus assembly protein TadG